MYHLQADSPLKGLGFNGADLGAYGMGSEDIGILPGQQEEEDPTEEPNEDLDNSTTIIDNSTTEHHKSSRNKVGYAVIVTPHKEIVVGSAELTKPTYKKMYAILLS